MIESSHNNNLMPQVMERGGYNYKECKELQRELEIDGAF
jgi:hypothetical protein